MRTSSTRRAALALSAALVACGGGGSGGGTTPPTTGDLHVTVGGLPAGVDADVNVAGPGGYTGHLTTTGTLSGLAPGSYLVTAALVSTGGQSYAADVTGGTPATVVAGEIANVTVDYTLSGTAPTVTAVTPASADYTAAGRSVAIAGTDFVAGATVSFDGTPGTAVNVYSSTFLTVNAPAIATGFHDVTVTTPGGTSATGPGNRIHCWHFTPYDITANGGQGGMTFGPDENVWFTERSTGKVGKVTPAGVVTEYTLPSPDANPVDPVDIAVGADGNLWVSDYVHAQVVRVTPTGTGTDFALPSGCQSFGITSGPGSTVWFTELGCPGPSGSPNKIGSIDTASTSTIVERELAGAFPLTFGMALGSDGNLWFAEYDNYKLSRITSGGTVTKFPSGSAMTYSTPTWVTAGPDGNLWFNESKLGVVTTAGDLTEHAVIGYAGGLVSGRITHDDALIWYSASSSIGSMDTATFANEDFPVAPTGYLPSGIAVDGNGVVWVLVQSPATSAAKVLRFDH